MTCHIDGQYFRCYFTAVYQDYSMSYNFRIFSLNRQFIIKKIYNNKNNNY